MYPFGWLTMVSLELLSRKLLHLPHQQKMSSSGGKSDGKAQCQSKPIPLTTRVWAAC